MPASVPHLRRLREERGLSPFDVAVRAGLNVKPIRRMEAGERVHPLTIVRVAAALEVNAAELTGLSSSPSPPPAPRCPGPATGDSLWLGAESYRRPP